MISCARARHPQLHHRRTRSPSEGRAQRRWGCHPSAQHRLVSPIWTWAERAASPGKPPDVSGSAIGTIASLVDGRYVAGG
jgi:hypothetical protein